MVAAVLPTWRLFNLDDVDEGLEPWLGVVTPIVAHAKSRSARLAANYYAGIRALELEGRGGGFTPPVADKLNRQALGVSLAITGPIAFKIAMRTTGGNVRRAADIATASSAGAAMRNALEGGRSTITEAVAGDRRALGYARATSGSACAFCAMLAGRGPVYGADSADFEAHDHCSCSAEPVFREDAAWPTGSAAYRDRWDAATDGLSGTDAVNAFRRSLAGGDDAGDE